MKTKKELRIFTIMDYDKEQEYLRKKHQAGWKFVKVSGLCVYHFVECQPEDVVYQLDYNQEGIEHKAEYVQMFADCGWEYLQDYMGYSYFRKPVEEMAGEEEIFCDDQSRLAMVKRIYNGRILPLLILFFSILIPQFILSITFYHSPALTAIYGVTTGLYIAIFCSFVIKYRNFKART